jgi:signal transduction histidine kinase
MSDEQFSILLVDDDEVDRLTIKRALKKAQFSVRFTEVKNGEKAIAELIAQSNNLVNIPGTNPTSWQNCDRINKNFFDLVLLDYRLPDINGLQLITEIEALNLHLPVIVLTGQGDEEIAVEIMKAGAADYFSKAKIEPNNLAKAISNAVRINKAEKTLELVNLRIRASNELLKQKNRELEQQKQQIKLQNIQLQESYKLKSEFLATMSHELRTPMNAIMGFSQLLLRQYPDPLSGQQQNLVRRIFNNSKNLLDMINEMLDFSKIEAGKLAINPQQFDLNYLLSLTIEELRSLALQKQINLTTEINLNDYCLIQDSNLLKRAAINLLSNAIKFTEEGDVKVQAWEIDETKIAISVSDTGIGIAPEDLPKIFQAFRQADQSFTRQHQGTGLGLAITDSLVKMMGGKISVQSELGKGSTFTIEIPRKYDAQI